MNVKKIGSLQIEPEAASKSVLFWTIQKIAIFFFVILLILSFLGYMGPGILGQTKYTNADNTFSISYYPYIHSYAANGLRINTYANSGKNLQIYFTADYINQMKIQQILPAPTKIESKGNYVVFTFEGNGENYQVNIIYEPQGMNLHHHVVAGKVGSPPISFTQWIYP